MSDKNLNGGKNDPELGRSVSEYLKKVGVETPMVPNDLTIKQKTDILEECFAKIWSTLGMDLSDDSLAETPRRMAKMYVSEIYSGLSPDTFPKCTTVVNKMGYDEMVIERNISVQSNCEHHGVVIDGVAHIGYIPKEKVLGLSKLNRIVRYFSKRPQIQERLTEQIYHALVFILETDSVAVMIDAQHFCVKSRGIEDVNSRTTTSKLGGAFKSHSGARSEFMSIVTRG